MLSLRRVAFTIGGAGTGITDQGEQYTLIFVAQTADRLRRRVSDVKSPHTESKRRFGGIGMNMRAETQSLVEEIKQSLRLLRRHL